VNCVETLEPRRMLSGGSASAVIRAGLLHVRGTRADDVIHISLDTSRPDAIQVVANDVTRGSFDLADLPRGIRVDAGAGDDDIQIDADVPPVTSLLLGGAGDDVLIGGPGQDVLDGGPGGNTVLQDAIANAPLLSQLMASSFVPAGGSATPPVADLTAEQLMLSQPHP